MTVRTSKKEPIELAWDEFLLTMIDRKHGMTDAFKFAWKASKPWVGLTEDEQYQLWQKWNEAGDGWGSFYESIEAALKEKNQ